MELRFVFCLSVALTWVWVILVGKSVSWDVINHHLYLPFSLVSGHFRTDFFAAGPQSYQNPLGYLPFYALVSVGAPDWLVATGLAAVHVTAVGAVYGIALQIWGSAVGTRFWRLAAVVAAWIAPILLIVIGTSSVDALSNVMVLWALWAALYADRHTSWRTLSLPGILLGLAFAVKPTNGVFVLTIGGILILRASVGQIDRRQLVIFLTTGIVATVLTMGPWSWWLWLDFGNPLFPLFNQYFHSPYAATAQIAATRFLPNDIYGYFFRLWEFLLFKRNVSTEAFIPDLRPLLLAVLLACAIARLTWRRRWWWVQPSTWRRTDVQLTIFAISSYVLWMKTSGNSRYAIPFFVVCGLLLVRVCQIVLPPRSTRVIVVLMLFLQIAYYGHDGEHRFTPVQWTGGPYLSADVPSRLKFEPFLHLSLGGLTSASLAPYLNRDGSLINVMGQMSLPTTGVLGDALQRRLAIWKGRTRILFRSQSANAPSEQSLARRQIEATVYRLGFQVDWADCETIWFESDPARLSRPNGGISMNDIEMPLLSCRAEGRTTYDQLYEQQHATVDLVFATIEATCPNLFSPIPFVSEYRANGSWQRFYMNTDAVITVSLMHGVFISQSRSVQRLALGSVQNVLATGVGFPCNVRPLITSE